MLRIAALLSLCASTLLAGEQALLVLLKGANALAYYTLEGQLLTQVPVGQHPHEMILSHDAKFAYITDNGTMRIENPGKGDNTISVVDLAARKRTGTISLGKYRRPHGISLDPVRHYLAVTTEGPDQLILIDTDGNKVIRRFNPKGKTSHMVSFGPGESGAEYAYVSNSGAAFLSVIQLTTGAVKTIPTGDRPEGSILSPNGKELYVCNRESASITVVDTTRRAAIGEIRTGRGPVRIGITPDGRTLVYALMHDKRIGFADTETRRQTGFVELDGQPISLHVSADGKTATAAAEEADTVYIVSIPDQKLIRQFKTEKGAGPDPVMLVELP